MYYVKIILSSSYIVYKIKLVDKGYETHFMKGKHYNIIPNLLSHTMEPTYLPIFLQPITQITYFSLNLGKIIYTYIGSLCYINRYVT